MPKHQPYGFVQAGELQRSFAGLHVSKAEFVIRFLEMRGSARKQIAVHLVHVGN